YDMRRQRNRETPCAMGLFAADVDGSGVWWEPSVDQMLAGAGVRRDPDRDEALDVRDAIASLSADDRLVLVLFYVNDFPVRQISQIMNVSEGAVHPSVAGAEIGSRLPYSQGSNEGLRWRDEP
ncbi:MAG: RNA polymerase sigma factor, partial [Eggerthella lenta]